jgi:Fe-S-cluster-containing dehydrogenase component
MSCTLNRRSLLKGALAAGATVAALPVAAAAAEHATPREDMVGLLYDATRCIGCKACMVACREANDMPYARTSTLYDDHDDLSADARNVIKFHSDGSGESSYMKMQCMHCIDPACATACMFGALRKREGGVVAWDGAACVGCRYCEIACPFNVPKFEWESANPAIVKCELCRHRIADGGIPACADVCPRDAVTFGRREDLLVEARRRMRAAPDSYFPKIYGEFDGGGTQVLYIAHVEFDRLGLPDLGHDAVPDLVRSVQSGIYRGFAAPVALYAVLTAAISRNRKRDKAHAAAHPDGAPHDGAQEAS